MAATPPDVSNSRPLPGTRLLELDVLRGIAAMGVLACHYVSECRSLGRVDFDFRLGSYGPHLFFIISGFVIFMTLNRCERPSDFVFSRFSRLYPVYWIAVLFTTTLLVLCPLHAEDVPTYTQVLGNLTMLQTWLRIPNIEDSYWTLGVELKFYLLMFVLLVAKRLERVEPLACIWLAAVVAFRVADAYLRLPDVLATPLILDYAHLFVAGIMFYRLRSVGSSRLRHGVIVLAIPLQFLAAGTESAAVVTLLVGLFYLFHGGWLSWIVNRPLKTLGVISYALYLVHGTLGITIIHWLDGYSAPVIVLLLAPTVVSVAIAWTLTRYFEQPCLGLLRSCYSNRGRWARPEQSAERVHA